MDKSNAFILWFDQVGIEDVSLVGGKNASLGEMYRFLNPKGVRVPNGFIVTAFAYRYLLEKTGAIGKIKEILSDLNTHNISNLQQRGKKVRTLIQSLEFPKELSDAIVEAYYHLQLQYGKSVDVAVRSSATAEDLPDASFAGQQDTFLNIHGDAAILEACRNCFASLFTDRAISYRADKGFDHFAIALSIGVQKMVRSDVACSGVMFSIDTESGFKESVFLTGAYGLGENVVQGAVNPDEWYIHKPTLKQGFRSIISKKVGEKAIKMVYTDDVKNPTKNIPVPPRERVTMVLRDEEVLELAKMACIIEDHYSWKAGHFKPMDMEWAKDGKDGLLYIVQARPETVQSRKDTLKRKEYRLEGKGEIIVRGKSVGSLIGAGKARVIMDAKHIKDFKKGEVLVTDMTDPDWEPIMKIASAIVTNRGGRTCHAAIISRELGIPCAVGTQEGTSVIKTGEAITVDCSQGSDGVVYKGILKFEVKEIDLTQIPETKTKIMMNIGSPDEAFEKSFLPNAGVGLAREEFIINSYISVHPLALVHFESLKDTKARKIIETLTKNYPDKSQFFVDKLAQGIGTIAAAFYPKKVIVRLSDFKSNEYANLIGGKEFEPEEDNPMIGWRGAARYYSTQYKDAFALECRAFLKVRNEMGLTNVEVLVPMVRTVEEGRKVLETMSSFGLKRGDNGLRVICMCEVPSNVILAREFLEIFDGFSIGSNDLTQLLLGVDRDSELVAHIYDERNDAVKRMIKQVIEETRAAGKYMGICGQAPSDYPEFAEFVVECGIETISLNPDTIIKTTLAIADFEKNKH